jgi:hypothetical protein
METGTPPEALISNAAARSFTFLQTWAAGVRQHPLAGSGQGTGGFEVSTVVILDRGMDLTH